MTAPLYQAIKANIGRLVSLTETEYALFFAQLRSVKLKKREMLLREGEVCREAFFINEGCLRYFFNVEGEEKSGQFFFENAWYSDFYSFTTGRPTEENIQALEASQLLAISRESLLQLFEQIPKLERWGRLIAENAFIGLKNVNSAFLNLSPTERYQTLVKERPKVIQRVPQHYIASYLGIQPESLSRIRKRLQKS
ncbi:MAG: Crp/Fnr family transcriptional regulator [Bacteroidota bacterium]